jgi:hypothetical protein
MKPNRNGGADLYEGGADRHAAQRTTTVHNYMTRRRFDVKGRKQICFLREKAEYYVF